MYAAILNNRLVMAVVEANKSDSNQKKVLYYCPDCNKKVILINSNNKKAYFKHIAYTKIDGETNEHYQSKMKICESMIQLGFPACTEVPLANRQLRADILINDKIAFEIQCAPLSDYEYNHRHNLYRKIRIQDVWIVGKKHFLKKKLNKTQNKYLRKSNRWGWYLIEVHINQKILVLKHHILLEPLNFKVSFFTKIFSLNENGLKEMLEYKDIDYSRPVLDQFKQQKYLANQICRKTKFGLEVAKRLYINQLTINDLPEYIFLTYREPLSETNVLKFLGKIKNDS